MEVRVKYKFKELKYSISSSHQLQIKVIYKVPGKLFPVVVEEELYWNVDTYGSILHLSEFINNQRLRRDYVLSTLKDHFKKEEDNLIAASVLEAAYGLFGRKGESFTFNDKELGLIEDKKENEDESI